MKRALSYAMLPLDTELARFTNANVDLTARSFPLSSSSFLFRASFSFLPLLSSPCNLHHVEIGGRCNASQRAFRRVRRTRVSRYDSEFPQLGVGDSASEATLASMHRDQNLRFSRRASSERVAGFNAQWASSIPNIVQTSRLSSLYFVFQSLGQLYPTNKQRKQSRSFLALSIVAQLEGPFLFINDHPFASFFLVFNFLFSFFINDFLSTITISELQSNWILCRFRKTWVSVHASLRVSTRHRGHRRKAANGFTSSAKRQVFEFNWSSRLKTGISREDVLGQIVTR